MITLQKQNGDYFVLNHLQVQCIEPILGNERCKITMMNKEYYLVIDTVEGIIKKIADYNAKVQDIYRPLAVVDRRR